ncbi:MAG: protoporphyrinogen oxidase [Deltaproteobacteria bacterium]|nr:protoporphyrinogen oxidase [Deltaproteobacteria bacterium]
MRKSESPVEFAIVGGGISGLACAFWLKRAGRSVKVLERTERPGGCIRTLRRDGWLFELGPNTITTSGGAVDRLVADAGLAGERLAAGQASGKRYIYKAAGGTGRLLALPTTPPAFIGTAILPLRAKLRLLREPFIPRPRPDAPEESVADFVRRRLGQEYLDYLVGPFVSGVYAGDPEKLSLRWAVRAIHGLEQDHGSLIRGALARRKGPAPHGALVSFRDGLETLPRALAATLDGDLLLGTEVSAIGRDDGNFLLETRAKGGAGEGRLRAEQLVLAAPADVVTTLLAPSMPEAGKGFAAIPYAPVVSVALGFRDKALAGRVDGFGFLAPRVEGLCVLGCLFSSSLFPGRAPRDCVGLTALAGGATQPELVGMPEEPLMEMILADLRKALGPLPDPVFRHVTRWPRAIPQYELGHGRFVSLARDLEDRVPGLHIAGNILNGISVADCVENAARLCERLLGPALKAAPHPNAPSAHGFFDRAPPVC